jgi:SAM-dependent methyltransferase
MRWIYDLSPLSRWDLLHVLASLLWCYLTAVFGWGWWRQIAAGWSASIGERNVIGWITMTALREALRREEIQAVRCYFPPGSRVLELGGDYGYQAGIIHSWGLDVTSIDIELPADEPHQYPVHLYNGRDIPFPDRTFDVVFSSNVLEHIEDVRQLLAEARRVLQPGGIMIHVLPSSTWRFWTSVARYVWLLVAVGLGYENPEAPVPQPLRRGEPHRFANLLDAVFTFPPHGAYSSAVSELYYYSRHRWRRLFRSARLEVIEVVANDLFYTGYKTLPRLSVALRRRLSKLLGSSCSAFILRPSA